MWDGDDLHLILDGTGAVKAKLTCYPGIDVPHSLQIGFERYHYALDHAGRTRTPTGCFASICPGR
ncbi:MAG: hypothetical protein RRA92_08040 [Gemmatimonadota bacterium]|nr:hypothetical protein [Gemmatimonadota bacterium]